MILSKRRARCIRVSCVIKHPWVGVQIEVPGGLPWLAVVDLRHDWRYPQLDVGSGDELEPPAQPPVFEIGIWSTYSGSRPRLEGGRNDGPQG